MNVSINILKQIYWTINIFEAFKKSSNSLISVDIMTVEIVQVTLACHRRKRCRTIQVQFLKKIQMQAAIA
jgi:hypothetical protein